MIWYSLLVVFTLMLIALSAQTSNQKKLTEEVQTILAGLPHLGGKPVLPSNFKDKMEVSTFFTYQCPHCQVELKLLKYYMRSYQAKERQVIAINRYSNINQTER